MFGSRTRANRKGGGPSERKETQVELLAVPLIGGRQAQEGGQSRNLSGERNRRRGRVGLLTG